MSPSLQPWPWIGPFELKSTSSCGLRTGNSVRSTRLTNAKMAALAPMPSASVATAMIAKPGLFTKVRSA
jgi:hypothetical protein